MPSDHPKKPIIHTAQVTALSHDGRGIAHINGKTTFIRGALPEEEVSFTYQRKHSKYDEGIVAEIIKAAPQRVSPKCAHFGVCGGCNLQHMASQSQILAKENILLELLAHIGGTRPLSVLPPLRSEPWGYRHKARLGVKYVHAKSKVLVGFREINGRYIADLQQCEVLTPTVGHKLADLSKLIASLASYQHIPQIEVAIGDTQTALIFRHLVDLCAEDLAKLSAFGQREIIHIYLQPGNPSSIKRLWPSASLSDDLLFFELPEQKIKLHFQPNDFTQINPAINQQMVQRALELLTPQADEQVLDLFCGLGNFTLALARHCAKVVGIEGEAALIDRAYANAKANQINNVEFYRANLFEDFVQAPWAQEKFAKILLDPPRTGAIEVIRNIAQFSAQKIVYISCNPSTLARDTAELCKLGYQLLQAGVMDMFPHTSHVESIAVFEKN